MSGEPFFRGTIPKRRPDPNLLDALRCLRAAQALAEEAHTLILHDESMTLADRAEMAHFAGLNATHLGLTTAYGERRMRQEVRP